MDLRPSLRTPLPRKKNPKLKFTGFSDSINNADDKVGTVTKHQHYEECIGIEYGFFMANNVDSACISIVKGLNLRMNLQSMTAHNFVHSCLAYKGNAQAYVYKWTERSKQNSLVPKHGACYQYRNIQIATRIQVTLEDVTMLGYCSGLWTAMSLSMLIPVIIANEPPHRHDPIVPYIIKNINFRFTDRENNSTKLVAMVIGCAMKPTLK